MNPLLLIVLLGAGWALLKGGGKTVAAASKDAPADANAMLATVLAPSLTDLSQLGQFFSAFVAGAANQTAPERVLRLSLYALVTRLKLAMLAKGASPDAAELASIATAPSSGMGGIQQLKNAPADAQQAAVAALVDTQKDVGTLGQYIDAIAGALANSSSVATKKRLMAYLLAIKAKQMMLQNGVIFQAPAYFAIANMAAPSTVKANSILSYK
jgi:hypothetical protein